MSAGPIFPIRATYRLQLHEDFDLHAAALRVPYLAALGISHLYLSPLLEARLGSLHGYDVTDPTRVRAALGGEKAFRELVRAARAQGLGILLDIVPNHMAASEENPWLRDVLARGATSPFARHFDFSWGDEPHAARAVRPEDLRTGDMRVVRAALGYRRFFDISDLIGVRVEDPLVFGDTHARALGWVEAGVVDALRIDHIDGLLDPSGYLRTLRERLDALQPEQPVPLYVEKILARGETLSALWPVDGTTGYDFHAELNGLFLEPHGAGRITTAYRQLTGMHDAFDDIVYDRKRFVLEHLFGAELRVLGREVAELCGAGPDSPAAAALAGALREITACLSVYRTYIRGDEPVDSTDRTRIRAAAAAAVRRGAADASAVCRLAAVLCLDRAALDAAGIAAHDAVAFIMRWQQCTGPVMAKGFEDTALYTYFPLASANDVGGDPGRPCRTPAELHAFLAARADTLPHTLNTTSTHDTKRSEDVRARINVLSELPDAWGDTVLRWRAHNRQWRLRDDAPTPNEEYLLYQTIVGAWPHDDDQRTDFTARIQRYVEKAMREAKSSTSWLARDEHHERAVAAFIERVLDSARNASFTGEVEALVRRIAPAGAVNSLAQLALKAWAPGVPDFYQGTEAWVLDLVDPDNRRPVDYAARAALLDDVAPLLEAHDGATASPAGAQRARVLRALLDDWRDARIKLLVTLAALRERRAAPRLFAEGGYLPLEFGGEHAHHLFGFARMRDGEWRAAIVPRLTLALCQRSGLAWPLGERLWGETYVFVPAGAPAAWADAITGQTHSARDAKLQIGACFDVLPLALLRG